jgi:hypothetical protein
MCIHCLGHFSPLPPSKQQLCTHRRAVCENRALGHSGMESTLRGRGEQMNIPASFKDGLTPAGRLCCFDWVNR